MGRIALRIRNIVAVSVAWCGALTMGTKAFLVEDVGDGRQPVVGLRGRNVVDVGRIRKIRRLVGDVSGHVVRLMSAEE